MAPEVRRVSFREDNKSRSASSRSSTLKSESGVGSTSTGSSYSGAQYSDHYGQDPLYEVNFLRQALKDSEEKVEIWKRKAEDIEKKQHKDLMEVKSRVQALEARGVLLEDDKKRLQREVKALMAQVSSLQDEKDEREQEKGELKQDKDKPKKKVEKQPATASSLEAGKPHRSGSKLSRDSESDKEKNRLSKRFEPRNENSSETSSAKQPSSKAPRTRRMSNASYADRPVYVEPYGQSAPRSTGANPLSQIANGTRYIATSKTDYSATPQYQDPAYSSTPRSTGLDRPSVLYQYPPDAQPSSLDYEDGHYRSYPVRR